MVRATLAGDHRASDGHRGGLFLNCVARHLGNPETLDANAADQPDDDKSGLPKADTKMQS